MTYISTLLKYKDHFVIRHNEEMYEIVVSRPNISSWVAHRVFDSPVLAWVCIRDSVYFVCRNEDFFSVDLLQMQWAKLTCPINNITRLFGSQRAVAVVNSMEIAILDLDSQSWNIIVAPLSVEWVSVIGSRIFASFYHNNPILCEFDSQWKWRLDLPKTGLCAVEI